MTRFKYDRHRGLVDEFGNQILILMAANCSKKFLSMAGKELANKLNTIEQGKERAAFAAAKKEGGPLC